MIIYKATNLINKRVYIGLTIRTIEIRKKSHEHKNSKSFFSKIIRKHGKENFSWEQIDTATSKEELQGKEMFWIKTYMSTQREFGYNIQIGGEYGDTMTNNPKIKEIVKKILKTKSERKYKWTKEKSNNLSKSLKGKKHPTGICPHCKRELSLQNLKQFHNEHCYQNPNIDIEAEKERRKASKETKKKMSEKRSGKKLSKKHCKNIGKGNKGKKEITAICKYCGKEMTLGNLSRWHNDHCYENPNVIYEVEKRRRNETIFLNKQKISRI